ncbi:MAG: DNA internalization-related competence protein ComEC/Rec2 [Caldisericia bacterium]|nr:DNA internalization-related competence protein ComEC/Rec2 [Caldisericia bacterium]
MRKLFRIIFIFFLLSLFSIKYPFLIIFLFIPILFIRRRDFFIFYSIFIILGLTRVYFFKTPSFLELKENIIKGEVVSYENENSFVLKNNLGKFLVYKNGDFFLKPGDKISIEGFFLNSLKGNPGEESYYIYSLTEGIRGNFYANKIEIIEKNQSLISKLREKIYNNLNIFGKNSEIFEGFIFGGKTVDSEIKELFKYSGTIHLFAISGIHLSILGGFFSIFLNPLIVIIILFIYLIIILFPVSALRAFFMYSFFLIGKVFKREIDTLNSLLFSAIILILINPLNLISPSFLLTFISTLSIITISEKFKNRLLKFLMLPSFIIFGSFPILIYFFPFFSFITLISNLVIIPLISLFLPVIFFFSLISIIFKESILILKPICYIIEKLVSFFSNTPLSSIGIKKPTTLFIIFYFIIYFIVVLIFLKEIELKKVKQYFIIFLIITLITFSFPYLKDFNNFKIIFFDVGEGDSILIKTPKNETILVDGGGTSDKEKKSPGMRVLNSLKRLGINEIDYVIFTHEDSDHIEGLFHVIKRVKIKNLLYPDINLSNYGIDLAKILQKEKILINKLKRGDEFEICGVKFFVLNPYPNGKEYLRANDNNNSLSIIVEYENFKFFLSGDIENEAIEEIYNLYPDKLKNVFILKVPHHGSKNSYNENFFNILNPQISVISVGSNNFGHPSDDVINYLNSLNSKIYRTDKDGAVECEIDNNKNYNIKSYNFSEITINLFE